MLRHIPSLVIQTRFVIGLVVTLGSAVGTAAAIAQVGSAQIVAEQQIFVTPDGDPNEGFGVMAISGDTAIVTSPFDDVSGRVDQGSAYVFVWVAGNWQFSQKLLRPTARRATAWVKGRGVRR